MPDLSDFISTEEAAEKLKYQIKQVCRMMQKGSIQGLRISRTWLVRRAALDGYMKHSASMAKHDPQGLKAEMEAAVASQLREAERWKRSGGLDGFALCSDYCFNKGPFLSPQQFSEFVAPYLAELIRRYRELGFYVIKHTDGNIMPILDQLVEANPHALHSLDPQAGVDIVEVKRRYGDQLCLIGNVNCGLLDSGSE